MNPNDFPTLEDFVGNTPLVRLQRLPGETSNTVLVKLEGNNPAGSVKDRPALSMIAFKRFFPFICQGQDTAGHCRTGIR